MLALPLTQDSSLCTGLWPEGATRSWLPLAPAISTEDRAVVDNIAKIWSFLSSQGAEQVGTAGGGQQQVGSAEGGGRVRHSRRGLDAAFLSDLVPVLPTLATEQKQQMQAQQMQQSTLAAPSFAQQTPQPLAGRQAQVLQTQVASPETPRAAQYPPQTFATGRTTNSQFPQSKNNARTSRTGQNQPLFKDSKALSDLRETVQRKSPGPLGVFNEEIMEAVMEANQMHGKQARLGPNSSQRAQLGREEAPAEEDSDNDSQGVNVHRSLNYALTITADTNDICTDASLDICTAADTNDICTDASLDICTAVDTNDICTAKHPSTSAQLST
ncbi:hypothetical protein QJQ45_005951 [Haematococcus lacustris]|nr:hypothetical protein QJQ45_005951 [Haematococcus lacustris]